MFKKSLVALALITASTGAFAAADITATVEKVVSIEGSASLVNVVATDVVVDLGAEYTVGDIITFTFAGGDVDVDTAPPSHTTNGVNAGSVTVGLLSSTASVLTYRVTEIVAGATTIGETITLADLEFDRDSVIAGGSTTVTYAAETSTGISIDAGTTSTADLFDTMASFTVAVTTDLDAVIDVEELRIQFTTTNVIDTLVFDLDTDEVSAYPALAAGVLVDVVLTGDFTYLDTDAVTAGIQLHANSSVTLSGQVSGTAAAVLTATTATWADIGVVAAEELTVTINSTGATALKSTNVIPEQTFALDLDINYDDHGTNPAAAGTAAASDTVSVSKDAGEWTLNGSVVNVPYLPFGPSTQPILRHTNKGAQTGDITLRYMVEGEHTSFQDGGVLVTLATPGVRNLLSEVSAALLADGYDATASGFKVALEITTNVPSGDATVYAAAKVTTSDSDRLTIGSFQ